MKLTLCRALILTFTIFCICVLVGVYSFERGVKSAKDFNCVKVNHNTMCEEVKK